MAVKGKRWDHNLTADMTHTINSKDISLLLNSLITDDQLSLTEFLALKARLNGNQNIDDRDAKRAKLQGRLLANSPHPQTDALKIVATLMLMESAADINYFKTISHADLDLLIQNPAQSPIFNEHASMFKRNWSNFILTGFGALAVLSVMLLLTGVLAPLGLTLAAGLSTTLAVAGGTLASLLVMERGLRIGDYEQDLQSSLQELMQQAHADARQPTEEDTPSLANVDEHPQQSSQATVVELRPPVVDSKTIVKPNPGTSPFSVFHHSSAENIETDELQSDNTLANK